MKKIKLVILLVVISLFDTTCTPFEPSPIKAYTLEVTYIRTDVVHPDRLYTDFITCTIGVPDVKRLQQLNVYSGDYYTYKGVTQEKSIADNSEYGITAGDLARSSMDDAWLSEQVGTIFKIRVVETGSELVLTNIVQLSQWSYVGSTENGRMAVFRIQDGLLY